MGGERHAAPQATTNPGLMPPAARPRSHEYLIRKKYGIAPSRQAEVKQSVRAGASRERSGVLERTDLRPPRALLPASHPSVSTALRRHTESWDPQPVPQRMREAVAGSGAGERAPAAPSNAYPRVLFSQSCGLVAQEAFSFGAGGVTAP